MKIAVLDGFAPSLVTSRGPLLKRLVSMGHEVHAMAPLHTVDVGPQLEAMGVEYSMVPFDRHSFNPFSEIGCLLHTKQVLFRIKPDVVLSCSFKPLVHGSMAARMAWVGHQKRVYGLVSGLGYNFTEDKGLIRRIKFNMAKGMYRSGLRACDGVIFQNDEDEKFFQKLGVVPSHATTKVVSGPGIDLEHFNVTPLPEKPTFLCIAPLVRSQGVALFAEAASRLKARYPEATFRLAGRIAEAPDAVKQKERAAWKSDGILETIDGLDDVRPFISTSSVFVLPSYYREGTPRSILEAMSMGRPVITSDAPGCRESVVSGENGFLTPLKDVDALTDAMEKFLTDPGLAATMGGASRKIAEEKFNAEAVNDALLSYMELI